MQPAAAIIAGALTGLLAGCFTSTETERRIREPRRGWMLFGSRGILGMLLSAIAIILATGFAMFGIIWLVLTTAGSFPMAKEYWPHYLFTLFPCLFLTKFLRYLYWKRLDPWAK